MVFWLVAAGVVVVALLSGWYVDRNAAKRGYRIHVRHSGMRREVTFEPIEPKAGARRRGGDDHT